MSNPLIETWEIHNRINLYLLDALKEADLSAELRPKGRTVGTVFAHMHSVRLLWLKSASPALFNQVAKIETDSPTTRAQLKGALTTSSKAIADLVTAALAGDGRIKGFKPHATAFVGYLISHESHHRGQIGMALRMAGFPLDKKVSFGIWEWGVR
jgi:uncharacterized damage-inducible protein DinB